MDDIFIEKLEFEEKKHVNYGTTGISSFHHSNTVHNNAQCDVENILNNAFH